MLRPNGEIIELDPVTLSQLTDNSEATMPFSLHYSCFIILEPHKNTC